MIIKGSCEGRNLEATVCVAEVDLSPKCLSNPTWAVNRFRGLMNVIIAHEYE